MSMPTREELLERFSVGMDDPEVRARHDHIVKVLLERSPRLRHELVEESLLEGRQEGRQEGRLTEARAALRRVLARRQLTPSRDDGARIEACADLATLERWLDQAITAVTISDAMA
jgi:predicted transposase YdaD